MHAKKQAFPSMRVSNHLQHLHPCMLMPSSRTCNATHAPTRNTWMLMHRHARSCQGHATKQACKQTTRAHPLTVHSGSRRGFRYKCVAAGAARDAPLHFTAAMLLAMAPDGYVSVAAQCHNAKRGGGMQTANDLRTAPPSPPASPRIDPCAARVVAATSARHRAPQRSVSRSRRRRVGTARYRRPIAEELRHPPPTSQDSSRLMHAAGRSAFAQALSELCAATASGPSAGQIGAARATRAWKLLMQVPRILLTLAAKQGSQGRAELLCRAGAFPRGERTQAVAVPGRPSRSSPQSTGCRRCW